MIETSEGRRMIVSFRDIKTQDQYSEEVMPIVDTIDYYLNQSKNLAVGRVTLYGEHLSVYIDDDEYTNDLEPGNMLLGVMDGSKTIALIPFKRSDTLIFNNMLTHATNTYITTLKINGGA